MSVWSFQNTIREVDLVRPLAYGQTPCCLCCGSGEPLVQVQEPDISEEPYWEGSSGFVQFVFESFGCRRCGWWMARRQYTEDSFGATDYVQKVFIAGAQLASLDRTCLPDEIAEARRQLVSVSRERRYQVNPYRLEEVVASVFRDFGYSIRVTGKSRDGGLDVILEGTSDSVVGVQVKGSRGKIGVAQIRDLIGALVLRKLTDGVFVTLSDYTKNAQEAALTASSTGYRVELINGDQFFNALGVAQRTSLPDSRELRKLLRPDSFLIASDYGFRYEQGLHDWGKE